MVNKNLFNKKVYVSIGFISIFIFTFMRYSESFTHYINPNNLNEGNLTSKKHTNSLINEQSAYLLQHSHNPVNWYPWKEEPFELAKKEKKLIFVSIGYSTCHWCHVMEKESFENEDIAKLLNQDYISIKVDKEELPHIDSTYQKYFSILNKNRNGWPLNFIMTPNKEIVYMGTYIPVNDDYGVKGLTTLLPKIAMEYKNEDKTLLGSIEEIAQKIDDGKIVNNEQKDLSKSSELFLQIARKKYDKVYKGFEKSPKFPLASHLNLLWDIYLQTNNIEAKNMVIGSLLEMSKGGINDHIEGGFFRYSVYPDWIIPHFEKMLYTQAELIPIYTKVYLHTKDERLKETIISTLEFANKTLKSQNGLYYSAIDADSKNDKGVKFEGFYYVYSYNEVENILLKNNIKNYKEILEYLNIDEVGNFEEHLNNSFKSSFEKPKDYGKAIKILKELRSKKDFPFIDKKMLTSWNAMMIKALVYGSFIDSKYLIDAKISMQSLEKELIKNGKLYHQTYENKEPSIDGLLEDYSFYIDALLALHQASLDKKYLTTATIFAKQTEIKFYNNKMWFLDESKEHEVTFNDRYYTAPISRLFHSLLSVATLNSDTKSLQTAKRYVNEQSNAILEDNWLSAEGIRAIFRVQSGDIVIKSNIINLQNNTQNIEAIKKPFIFKNVEEGDIYLACDESSCFAYDKNIQNIIKTISIKNNANKDSLKWK